MKRREWIAAAAATALCGPGPAHAQVTDLNEAINRAGRQRMLSQRVGKAYLALVQAVEPSLAQQVLDRSMALFDRQLVELKAFAVQPDLRETYGALESAWSEYKGSLVGTPPSRAGVPAVMANGAKVLALAHRGTQQYESLLNKPVGKLVNIAGRQRMLSQRIAKFHLASVLDVGASRAEVAKAQAEFAAATEVLRQAPEATQKIRDELQLADAQWLLFNHALAKSAPGTTGKPLSDVFIASENLLVVMDRITGLYSGLKA